MKTLNKTLSLVLVLVMVLGLFGVASAASFTDSTDVKYTEAVGVMTGIGAINGYTDGSVKPAGTITREEAAKLVAYAVLGADVAKNLKASVSSFSDVAADRWSAPFIAYCVNEGIINGMGDGTFAPTANVTGYQLAKMMLCAAGYGAKGEYTGAGWELAVAVDANKYGIFADAKDVNFTAAATREEAMLYTFNGLFVDQVEYNAVFGSYISNKGFNIAATTIAADTYGTKLVATPTTDSFGNVAVNWTYKGVNIGTYTRDVAYTYTKLMNTTAGKKELATTFKNFTVAAALAGDKIQLNGADAAGASALLADGTNLVSEIAAVTANGRTVCVYVNPNKVTEVTAITAFDTELAQVSNINATTKIVTVTTVNSSAKYTADSDNATYKALSAMKVDDYVLVSHVGTAVATIATPAVVTGKLTNLGYTDGAISSVTVAGKSYPISAKQTDISSLNSTSLTLKNDVTLYVDGNGFAIYIDDVTATTPYMAVVKISNAIVNNVVINMVTGYAPDGTVVTLNTGSVKPTVGDIYSYAPATAAEQASTDAEYKLTAVTQQAAGDSVKDRYDVSSAAIAAGDTMFNGAQGTSDVPYASGVKFIFIDSTGITVKSGVQKVTTAANATALYVQNAAGTLVVPVVYVKNAPEDATGANILYLAKYTGISTVNDKAVYGFIAMIDGMPTPINAKSDESANVGKFFTYAKDDATGVYTVASYDGTASAANKTKTNDQFASLTAGYILNTVAAADGTTASLTNINAKNAAVVDLTQTGYNTLADIAAAKAEGKTVILSIIYDDLATSATYKTVKIIYVVAVVTTAPTTVELDSTFTWDAANKRYALGVKDITDTAKFTVTGLPTGITVLAAAGDDTAITAAATVASDVVTFTTKAAGAGSVTLTTMGGIVVIPVFVTDLA